MSVLAVIVYVIVFALLQALYNNLQGNSSSYNGPIHRNLTLAELLSSSVLETWIADSSKSTTQKLTSTITTPNWKNETSFSANENTTKSTTDVWTHYVSDENTISTSLELQGDDASVPSTLSFDAFVESLFEPPVEEVEPDWRIVLGTFSHYDDENWKEFLIQTEVPMIVRMFLADSSETVTFSRKLKKNRKNLKQGEKTINPKLILPSDYEMTISTSSWILTVDSKFHLGEMVIEHDLDGTDSKNTFFFSNPRLLIHNKIKDRWRTAIVRHFDETGLNMTFVDRDRLVWARRFLKRIE